MGEITPWPGNTDYGVTRDGRVFRLKPWRFGKPVPYELSPWTGKNGYLYVGGGNSELGTRTVHRMVAETFIPNPDGLPDVAHKNGVRSDNRDENLRWDTRAGNMADTLAHGTDNRGQKHILHVLTNDDVIAIRASRATGQAIAERYGISRAYAYQVRAGRARVHG